MDTEQIIANDGEPTPTKSSTLKDFFDDIVMTPPSCRRDKPECESCAG